MQLGKRPSAGEGQWGKARGRGSTLRKIKKARVGKQAAGSRSPPPPGQGRDLVQTPENIRRGRREGGGGGAGTGCRNNRSLWPLVIGPISGLAPVLGRPWSGTSLQE